MNCSRCSIEVVPEGPVTPAIESLAGFGEYRYDGRRHRRSVTTTESLTPKVND
jgi:hypothetical protein